MGNSVQRPTPESPQTKTKKFKYLTKEGAHGQANEAGQHAAVEALGHEWQHCDPTDGHETDQGHTEQPVTPHRCRARLLGLGPTVLWDLGFIFYGAVAIP